MADVDITTVDTASSLTGAETALIVQSGALRQADVDLIAARATSNGAASASTLSAHTTNTSNPHSTTAAQVGAEPALGNPGTTGYVLSSTTDGVRSWVAQSAGGGVSSVNGQTGAVTLGYSDVGAAPTSHTQAASTISDSTTAGRALLTAATASAQRTALGLGTAATEAATAFAAAAHASEHAAAGGDPLTLSQSQITGLVSALAGKASTAALDGYQPLDSDLTAIAALSTTAFGRGLLALADAAALRSAAGLGTAAQSATGDFAAASHTQAASTISDSTAAGRAVLTAADAAAQRSALGLGTAATQASTAFMAAITAQTLTDGASIAWNVASGVAATVTLGGARALANPTNIAAGSSYVLIVKQDATGGRTLSFGSAYKWPGGTAPTITATANATDILTFISDGTNMYGVAAQAFA